MVCNIAAIVLLERPSVSVPPIELLLLIMAIGVGIAAAIVAASFVVAFYLIICGVPIAALLGHRITHPAALGIALVDALISAAFAVSGSILNPSYEPGFPWVPFLMVACFALPAGYLYRRNVIAMREEVGLFT